MFRTTLRLLKRRFESSACPTRWPIVLLTACSVLVLALSGCGNDPPAQAEAPRIPAQVGTALADDAAAVAAALEAGDPAAARAASQTLAANIDAAIAAGDIPSALRAELLGTVARLVVNLPEVQPPPAPEPPKKEEKKKEKKKPGKDKKHDPGPSGDGDESPPDEGDQTPTETGGGFEDDR